MTLDLDAIKASQKRVYYGTDLADKEAHALAFLDSGVVDDLVAEVERLRSVPEPDNHHNAYACPHCEAPIHAVEAERDRYRAEVKRLLAKYEPTPEQMADVEQRIQRLMDDVVEDPRDAALARVRALHTDTLPPLSPYCPACNDVAPCPTIRAIDGGAS